MASLEQLNLLETQNVVNRFRNLLYHRTMILESIRKITFRNMGHFMDAIQYVESNTVDIDESQWVDRVQKKMLFDQGLEDNKLNKTLIGYGTYCPLQVYLALLYAEIEFYKRFCIDIDILNDDVFSSYLDTKTEFTSKLSKFRDFYLHPSKDNSAAQLDFLSMAGSYNEAPGLQVQLDEYLVRTRLKILDNLKDVLFGLPEIERLNCTLMFLRRNFKRMKDHGDADGMEHVAGQLEGLQKQFTQLAEDIKSQPPNQRQIKSALVLAELLNELNPSGPEQQYIDLDPKQSAMTASLLYPLVAGRAPASYGSGRHASYITENVGGLRNILMTVGVLANETITFQGMYRPEQFAEFAKEATISSWEDAVISLSDIFSSLEPQRLNELASLSRVSFAFLYEPLRLYSDIEKENPNVMRSRLRLFTTKTKLQKLKMYRNSVFHVLDPRRHPLEVDLAISDPDLLRNSVHLYGDLAAFFGFTKQDNGG